MQLSQADADERDAIAQFVGDDRVVAPDRLGGSELHGSKVFELRVVEFDDVLAGIVVGDG